MTISQRSRSTLAKLGHLPGLDVTTLEGLSHEQKDLILAATSQICRKLMEDLGVKWKPQPVDSALRSRTINWIKSELEPEVGPVDKRFLISTDTGLTYTERVYEGGDFETKVSMVKYVTVAIYLDDMIDKNADIAKEAESFLFKLLDGRSLPLPPSDSSSTQHCSIWLEQYRKVSIGLASHMTDPFVSNMLLHSCTLYIEGCALEHHIQRDQTKYFLIRDAGAERARDDAERKLADDHGFDVPMPLDSDRDNDSDSDSDYLVPHGWPLWLRERSAVAETFAITSFRAPRGVDVPTWVWVTAIPELRTIILSINDLLSFAKELLADDTTSSLAVLTKERRLIGMPGTAPDGGWCLRDSFDEVMKKTVVAGARINRLLRPSSPATRYGEGGRAYSIGELVAMLKALEESNPGDETEGQVGKDDLFKALALKLWETHQRGYVAWHFQSPRYRTHELFDWAREMMGPEAAGPEWLTSCFTSN